MGDRHDQVPHRPHMPPLTYRSAVFLVCELVLVFVQNTCILGKMGPCDNIDAADELCCAETSKEAQAQCHCHKTSPQDDPCCGLSDHTAQAACGALMNKMDHDGKSADLMQINKLNAFWARTA